MPAAETFENCQLRSPAPSGNRFTKLSPVPVHAHLPQQAAFGQATATTIPAPGHDLRHITRLLLGLPIDTRAACFSKDSLHSGPSYPSQEQAAPSSHTWQTAGSQCASYVQSAWQVVTESVKGCGDQRSGTMLGVFHPEPILRRLERLNSGAAPLGLNIRKPRIGRTMVLNPDEA
ncbi:MAG: hypothetical protein M1840_006407 [Geoglossum simile]|nr:MAG: hypothetical protein M1840_006407 [Geoglossum simile]